MRAKTKFALVLTVLVVLGFGCARTIQTDKSIKEERSSNNETGPLQVTAVVRRDDGSPLANAGLHLMIISRDDKGGLKQVDQILTVTNSTKPDGSLRFEIPRKEIAGVKEFSLALNPSAGYGPPAVIRRKDAKEILSFKADEKTTSVDLGDVVILVR
jgi:hypothetical protein